MVEKAEVAKATDDKTVIKEKDKPSLKAKPLSGGESPPAVVESAQDRKARLRKEAATLEHRMLHYPYNEECEFCVRAWKTRKQKRRKSPRVGPLMNGQWH